MSIVLHATKKQFFFYFAIINICCIGGKVWLGLFGAQVCCKEGKLMVGLQGKDNTL